MKMNYRFYKQEDYEKIKELCQKHNLNFPYDNQILVVAEDDRKEIIGVGGIRVDYVFNPLISENNPLVANNLVRIIEGILMAQGIKRIRAEVETDNGRHIGHLEKFGFEIIEKSKIILHKLYE